MPTVLAEQPPRLGLAGVRVRVVQFDVDPVEAERRRELVVVPGQREVRPRGDQGVDLRGREVLQQRRDVVVDAVAVEAVVAQARVALERMGAPLTTDKE